MIKDEELIPDEDALLNLLESVRYEGDVKDWRDVPETEQSDDEPDEEEKDFHAEHDQSTHGNWADGTEILAAKRQADLIDKASGIVNAYYREYLKTSLPERAEIAAKAIGCKNHSDYARSVFDMIQAGGDDARIIGDALREDFFGQDYGSKTYEKLAKGDYTGTAGIINELARRHMTPTTLSRIDSGLKTTLKAGDEFNFDTPVAFTIHQSAGVFRGQVKVVVEGANRGTSISVFSPYPREGEVLSYHENGYAIDRVAEENGRTVYYVKPKVKEKDFHYPGGEDHDQSEHGNWAGGGKSEPEHQRRGVDAQDQLAEILAQQRTAKRARSVERALGTVVARTGRLPRNVSIMLEDKPGPEFKVDGKTFYEGASYNPVNHEIKIYPTAFGMHNDMDLRILSHEVQHSKWEAFQVKAVADMITLQALPRSQRAKLIKGAGSLNEAGKQAFPFFALKEEIADKVPTLMKDDGVTRYSEAYWQDYEKDRTNYKLDLALNETLAEVASWKVRPGNWFDLTKPVSKTWLDLYDNINKLIEQEEERKERQGIK